MGTLSVVSTPIGNLEDITIRAIKTLFSVDIIVCEDTRRTGLLLESLRTHYASDKKPRFISYYDEVEEAKAPELISLLEEGQHVALISDAGTPLINDPGFRLVSEAIKRGIKVESVPGASAVLTALTSSGLPTNKFMFLGYPPEKTSHRKSLFSDLFQCFKTLKQISPTIVFYCAPHKLDQTLDDMKEVFGDIEIIIARELTKIHEEVWRGRISEAQQRYVNPQGEFVLLFHYAIKPSAAMSPGDTRPPYVSETI